MIFVDGISIRVKISCEFNLKLNFFLIFIKLTRGVCRGLPCYAASPEKLFSFLGKYNNAYLWLM